MNHKLPSNVFSDWSLRYMSSLPSELITPKYFQIFHYTLKSTVKIKRAQINLKDSVSGMKNEMREKKKLTWPKKRQR